MEEALKKFHAQFEYEPVIENNDSFRRPSKNKYTVVGMGGSALSAGLLETWKPNLDITTHRTYGLPEKELGGSMVILSSYSGNTEEVIDAYQTAIDKNLNTLAVSTGGKLLEIAQEKNLAYIKLPSEGIQPRTAVGLSFLAMLKATGEEAALKEIKGLKNSLKPAEYENRGKELAEKLKGATPVIYSSWRNKSIAYIWKITFNETGKIPAFFNVLPELNHNEMTGFDTKSEISKHSKFIFLKDSADHPRIIKRMKILETLYQDRGFEIAVQNLEGPSLFYKIFSSVILAGWTALHTAKNYGFEPEEVPMVEEFKTLIKQ